MICTAVGENHVIVSTHSLLSTALRAINCINRGRNLNAEDWMQSQQGWGRLKGEERSVHYKQGRINQFLQTFLLLKTQSSILRDACLP